MDEITITLPIPPSTNDYWRYSGGRVYVSDEARAYKQEVALLVRRQVMAGPVGLNISVFRPRRRGDLDNYLKVMLDALKGILYNDDDQIVEFHAFRYDDKHNPRVVLIAYEIKESE